MPKQRVAGVVLMCGLGVGLACSPNRPDEASDACGLDDSVMEVSVVLADEENPCREWLDAVHGRSVRVEAFSGGSGTLWWSGAPASVAILATAAHVMSPCWGVFSAQDDAGIQPNCTQTLWNPAAATDSAFVRLARPAGGPPASQWSPAFPLFNPTFPVADLDPLTLRPGNDFALYVVDGQLQEAFSEVAPRPAGPLDDTPPSFHDPLGLAGSLPSWATPDPGDFVLSVGFPVGLDAGAARLEHYSVGRVLTDEEARAAIARLDTLGDAEGLLPYASESEFILEGRALPGMSGSGVFDDEGRLVGIVVRASTGDPETQYVRAVRMSWIVSLLAGALSSLSPRERVMMERYLPPL